MSATCKITGETMACYRTDCVEKPISKLFEKLGHLVGSYPVWFFVIPLIVSAALGGGLYFLKDYEDNDVENQFTPINGPSKQARDFVKETFPSNDSLFSSQRLYAEGNYAVMIFSVEGDILADTLFEKIRELDKQVHNLYVDVSQTQISFKDICAKENGNCEVLKKEEARSSWHMPLDFSTFCRINLEHLNGFSSSKHFLPKNRPAKNSRYGAV
ncbi:hypothetical protein M9458_057220 [Cirrhinus mrigala]|uniref:Patched domain containing 3 n=1 Tax=Cirrhinus mrigala TaxID=683832 RepID=A0ABD0MEW1_CIRMR